MRAFLLIIACALSGTCAFAAGTVLHCDFEDGDAPGISGRGFSTGAGPEKRPGRGLPVEAFSPAAGSCCFWVKPVDWTGDDAPFCLFFTAQGKDYRFMVYKQARGTLLVLTTFRGKTFKTTANISGWREKEWHHVAVVWGAGAVHLYVDGRLNNSGSYPAVPSDLRAAKVIAGALGWKAEKGISVLDELKLFPSQLAEREILDVFFEFSGLRNASFEPFEIAAGPGPVRRDGRISDGEYPAVFTGWYQPGGGFIDDRGRIALAAENGRLAVAVEFPGASRPQVSVVRKDGKVLPVEKLSVEGKLPGTVEFDLPFGEADEGIVLELTGKDGETRRIVPDEAGFLKIVRRKSIPAFSISKLGDINGGRPDFHLACAGEDPAVELTFADDRKLSFSSRMKLAEGKLRFTRIFAPDGRFGLALFCGGETLFKAVIPAERTSHVTVSDFHTDTSARRLAISFGKFRRGTTGRMELCLKNLKDGSRHLRTVPVPGEKMMFSCTWPLQDVPEGEYLFTAQFVDARGKAGQPWERLYAVFGDRAPWQGNRIGVYPGEVPAPWTPLEKLDGGLRTRMQEYRFGEGLFFDSVKSLGRELLASPAEVWLNGQKIAGATGRFVSFSPDTALFRSRARAGAFDVELDTCAEYDGLLKHTLRIRGQGEIGSLSVRLPLKPEFSRLVYSNDRKEAVRGPGATGRVPAEGWSRDVYDLPAVWVGGGSAGISWCAENLKNWSNAKKDRTVEIRPGEKSSLFILNLADRPVKVSGERVCEFYFQATPVRPYVPGLALKRFNREFRIVRGEKYFNYLRGGEAFFDAAMLRRNIERGKKEGAERFFYYVNTAAIGTFTPEWPWWAEHWNARGVGRQVIEHRIPDQAFRNRRVYSDCCLNSRSFLDFMVWQVSRFYSDPRFMTHDIYFDSCGPRQCRQSAHGCSWRDDEGKIHPTLVISATREFFKRVNHVRSKHAPGALSFQHATDMAGITPCRAFADGFVGGENMYRGEVVRNGSYIGIFDHDYFSAAFSGEKWGYPVYFIPQQVRAALMFRPQEAALWNKIPLGARQYRSMRHIVGFLLAHGTGIWVRDPAVAQIQQPVQELMLREFPSPENVEFLPPSSGRRPFAVKCDSRALQCGAYSDGKKCLAVLFNDSDAEAVCTLVSGAAKKVVKVPSRDFVIEAFAIQKKRKE